MTEPRPVLRQVNLVTRDMEACVAFYERLGLDVAETVPAWAPHHRAAAASGTGAAVEFDSEAFAGLWNAGRREGFGVLGFTVPTRDDVDRLYDRLTAAGAPAQQPPVDAFWGARMCVVADPDGNAVGIMSPVDPTRRSAPPAPP